MIPYEQWEPLSLAETVALFSDAPFAWGLGAGYAVELFLGSAIRSHEDIDVLVFRDDLLRVQDWLRGWALYAADPPGTLRPWREGEALAMGIHDIWAHREGAAAWQLQLIVAEVDGDEWFSRRDPRIRGRRDDLLTVYSGLPSVRIEVQLMHKAKGRRAKDELDFQAAAPKMSAEAKQWLKDALALLYPEGHPWLEKLQALRSDIEQDDYD